MSEAKINKICNQLSAELLTIADMEICGLSGKSLNEVIELINEGNLDRIVFSKFGHYLDQGPATILMTKAYDIKHNKLGDLEGLGVDGDDKDKGICFWALKRLNVDDTRNFLSFAGENKGPRYVIMPYTMSKVYEKSQNVDKENEVGYQSKLNPQENENLDEFFDRIRKFMAEKSDLAKETFAFEYALDEKKIKKKKYFYPETMFLEVISKSEINKAFLISELSYFKGNLKNVKDFYNYFMSHTKDYGEQNELATTLKGSKSHSCAMLKAERKEEFIEYLKAEVKEESDVTSFLIAKLEYPYIVALQ